MRAINWSRIMKNFKFIILLLSLLLTNISFGQWELRNNGINNVGVGQSIDAVGSNFVVASYGIKLYKTNNTGLNWSDITPEGNNVIDISAVDSLHIWAATDLGRILGTTDGGEHWDTLFYDPSKTPFMNYIKMFDVSNGIAMGDANNSSIPAYFLRTTNGGQDWTQVNTNLIGAYSNDTWRTVDFPNIKYGFFGIIRFSQGVPGIYKTTDGGITWNATGKNTDENYTAIKFYDENIGIIAPRWGMPSIIRTNDGLVNVDTVKDTKLQFAQHSDIEFVPGDPSKILYTNYSDLLFSSDTGKTWQSIKNEVIDSSLYEDIVFTDSKHCWILCDDGRIYYTPNIDIVTAIEKSENNIPEEYILAQNLILPPYSR